MDSGFVYAFVLIFSLVLASLAFLCFQQSRSQKGLLTAMAFSLFAAKGVLFSIQLFAQVLQDDEILLVSGLFDLGILATIFAATLKR